MTSIETPTVSPFKFLDAYTASDAGHFYGRQAEQERLSELIFSSKLVLVYGASGTGKSSLVQCGLSQTLSLADYFPVIIRRRGNFSAALCNTLRGILGEEDEGTSAIELVQRLSRQALRPVYLMFDQFEELFISGTPEEQLALIDTLQILYETDIVCKLLIIMREEYIARLNLFEERLPQLFDFRLRVEGMRGRMLEEVITRTFEAIKEVELVAPNETSQAIIQNISLDKALFQLPYLQVYLDRLWRRGKRRAEKNGADRIIIDPELVTEVGEIENVLETFFQEQKEALLLSLKNEQGDIATALDKVLSGFVTYDGTRREQTLVRITAETGLDQALISAIFKWLENSRLLREDEGTYELPHDCLALIIDKGRSSALRRLNDILRRLKDSYQEYAAHPCDDFWLNSRRLGEVREMELLLREELTRTMPVENEKIWVYIEQSEQYQKQKHQEEVNAQQEKYRQKQQRIILFIMIFGTIISTCIAFFAYKQGKIAEQEKTRAEGTLDQLHIQKATEFIKEGKLFNDYKEPELAKERYKQANEILNLIKDKNLKRQVNALKDKMPNK